MRYEVTIEETLARTMQVEASSEKEAELAVRRMYCDCNIVLTDDDYVATEFRVGQDLNNPE